MCLERWKKREGEKIWSSSRESVSSRKEGGGERFRRAPQRESLTGSSVLRAFIGVSGENLNKIVMSIPIVSP